MNSNDYSGYENNNPNQNDNNSFIGMNDFPGYEDYSSSNVSEDNVYQETNVTQEPVEQNIPDNQSWYQETVSQETVKNEFDLEKIDKILNAKSKNEKIGLYGIIGSIGVILVAVIYGLISDDDFYYTFFPIIASILVITFLVIYLVAVIKRKKLSNRSDIDAVKSELLSSDLISFDRSQVYLTKNYIVSHGLCSNILRYDEIAVVYNQRLITNVNGVRVDNGIYIVACLMNGKKINIVRTYDESEVNAICQVIGVRNPNILFGNSKENMARLKELKKNYRNVNKA